MAGAPTGASAPKANILLVDDQPANLVALEAVLVDLDQNLVRAGGGAEALRRVLEYDFAVILLDVRMPGMDGYETARLIRSREKSRHTPIIFVTAHDAAAPVVVRAYKEGAADHLVKPFVPEILRSKVARFVELYQKTEQIRALERQAYESRLDEEKQRWEVERLREELTQESRHSEVLSQRAEKLTRLSNKLQQEIDERLRVEEALRASIAEQKRTEEALKEADRHKDEFLAMLAHELRNPLAPVRNGLHILKSLEPAGSLAARTRDMIERQTDHLTRLVDDLVDVSRLTRGQIELRPEAALLEEVVTRAVETARPLIDERQHVLTVTLPPQPVWLEADAVRLAQVFANLLVNAAKYTDPGGRITVAAELETHAGNGTPAELVVRVQDTGKGIPAELLPRIFDLFQQGERSLDRSEGGLGIGLTLVRQLVAMHGGHMQVFSDGPGRGSTFVVFLPLPKDESGRMKDEPKPIPPSSLIPHPSIRVLVVDDNLDGANMLALLLKLWGHDHRLAHDGPGAVKTADVFRPEVVLLDIGLPGMDGYEVARRLRDEAGLKDVFLVAVTGYGQEDDLRRSRESGFDHHLVKPVDPEALEQLLAHYAASRRFEPAAVT
jgi:signal transduction histidine kinase